MSAYNSIIGTPRAQQMADRCAQKECYKGYVVSDWGAVYAAAYDLAAGSITC